MAYFIVIGRDAKDEGAPQRRIAAREAHVEGIKAGKATGQNIMGAATLNDAGDMDGSIMTMQFDDREALDEWLKTEPYVLGNVWDEIEVIPCAIPPVFMGE